jgi:hypothetical protein
VGGGGSGGGGVALGEALAKLGVVYYHFLLRLSLFITLLCQFTTVIGPTLQTPT